MNSLQNIFSIIALLFAVFASFVKAEPEKIHEMNAEQAEEIAREADHFFPRRFARHHGYFGYPRHHGYYGHPHHGYYGGHRGFRH